MSNKHLFELGAALLATGGVAFVLVVLLVLSVLVLGALWLVRWARRRISLARHNDEAVAAGWFADLDATQPIDLAAQLGVPTQVIHMPQPSSYLIPGEDFRP